MTAIGGTAIATADITMAAVSEKTPAHGHRYGVRCRA
jgi:hypothetical protein